MDESSPQSNKTIEINVCWRKHAIKKMQTDESSSISDLSTSLPRAKEHDPETDAMEDFAYGISRFPYHFTPHPSFNSSFRVPDYMVISRYQAARNRELIKEIRFMKKQYARLYKLAYPKKSTSLLPSPT